MPRRLKSNRFIADQASGGSTDQFSGSEGSDNEQGSIADFIQEESEESEASYNHQQFHNKKEEQDDKALETKALARKQYLEARALHESGDDDDHDDDDDDTVEPIVGRSEAKGTFEPTKQEVVVHKLSAEYVANMKPKYASQPVIIQSSRTVQSGTLEKNLKAM
eukprot:g18700.t1